MYFQPYGDEQQLNLNWIINEIINLHKQLDPDYETPSFEQIYPYSNLNRLNLDWVLSELKALKELAPEPTPIADIQAVAEALVALPFDSNTSYQIYDFISRDGEIWRAKEAIAAGGVWDSSKWFKTKIGTDLTVLDRWINAINANLTTLQNTVKDLSSDEISDDSDAGGATVKESLNNLKGSLNTILGKTITYERKATATSDISTPVAQGLYVWYITSSTPDNFGEGGVILVIGYADWIQAQLGYGNSGKMYFRQYNSGAWTAWKIINTDTAPIIPPPDFYNSVKKATPQLDGTISSFVVDASGWYQARAVNRSVSGQCETNICNSNGDDVYSANCYPEGTYIRAPSTWVYYKSGQTIYYRIWATDSDYSGLFYAPSIT